MIIMILDLGDQVGVVTRLAKDVTSYKAEADIQQARLERMVAEGRDEYDVMKMGQVTEHVTHYTLHDERHVTHMT